MGVGPAELLHILDELHSSREDWSPDLMSRLGEKQLDCFLGLYRIMPHEIFGFFSNEITDLLQNRLDLGQNLTSDQQRMFNMQKGELRRRMVDDKEFNKRNSGDTSAWAMAACGYIERLAELSVGERVE